MLYLFFTPHSSKLLFHLNTWILKAYSEPSPLLFDRRPAKPSTKEAERVACKRPDDLDHLQEGT